MKRFRNILYVAEPNFVDHIALERAVDLANNNEANLTVAICIEKIPSELSLFNGEISSEELQENIASKHEKAVEDIIAPWKEDVQIKTQILIGTLFLEVIRKVLRDEHDLVIKSSRGERSEQVFGGENMRLLRKCPCPVWLFKSESPKKLGTIVAAVGLDDSYQPDELDAQYKLNCQILEMAVSLAISEFAELHIVHSWNAVGEDILRGSARIEEEEVLSFVEEIKQRHKNSLDELLQKAINKLGGQSVKYAAPQLHLLKGEPETEIPNFSNRIKADLIVMGTVARSGISGFFMGNTAEKILGRIDCSVLTVKPPGFVTPIKKE